MSYPDESMHDIVLLSLRLSKVMEVESTDSKVRSLLNLTDTKEEGK